jgi:hypothetical protein
MKSLNLIMRLSAFMPIIQFFGRALLNENVGYDRERNPAKLGKTRSRSKSCGFLNA